MILITSSKKPLPLTEQKKYNHIILLVDFNIKPKETNMSDFLGTYHLKNIVKQNSFFKNRGRLTCINLISKGFQVTCAIEIGLSDFRKLVFTILKLYLVKLIFKPSETMKYSIKQVFRLELHYELLRLDVWVWAFFNIFDEVWSKYTTMKSGRIHDQST